MPAAAWRRPVDAWSIDDRAIPLTQQPLRVMVGLLLSDSPVPMLMGTVDDPADADWLAVRIVDPDGGVTDELLERIADGIADVYFARERWQAQALWRRALASWHGLDGELSSRGVDLMEMTADRATNVVYRWLITEIREDKAALEQFRTEMSTPPAAVQIRAVKVVKNVERQQADWNALAALAAQAQDG